ncbi:subclass B3 metallo-beta-lactamase [Sphingomonas turrisvirgatae]|uniref:Subclass B3 metallo-beta-lactamase n=1 Tax=Sphingomonas turrisvirgatae TaxID=1888892 RepID=A0A1E3LVW2_9SPHN|nr:subclass B3 metallo-beta-lactamase [Sphingomonas turrisvirgatae]ODP37927.1 subclass B3 metallo-beta-lactamase [Sphingomonas turrisvirgatae]
MSVKPYALATAIWTALVATPAAAQTSDASPAALVASCAGKDGWSDPAPPARIFGNVYQVGTCGIVALLITSDEGHVLIDAATDKAAPGIARNIEALGFRLRDVKVMLNGHEHLDHAGGFAAMQRLTGARLLARAPAKAALESGKASADDPQIGLNDPFPGARVDGIVADRQVVRVGPIVLTAHATPGHTPGSTSWSWRSCDRSRCRNMVYADSISALSHDNYRFSDHPAYVAAYRAGLDRIAGLNCDILITPHPGASNLYDRLIGKAPLVDRRACAAYAKGGRERLSARLAREGAK